MKVSPERITVVNKSTSTKETSSNRSASTEQQREVVSSDSVKVTGGSEVSEQYSLIESPKKGFLSKNKYKIILGSLGTAAGIGISAVTSPVSAVVGGILGAIGGAAVGATVADMILPDASSGSGGPITSTIDAIGSAVIHYGGKLIISGISGIGGAVAGAMVSTTALPLLLGGLGGQVGSLIDWIRNLK